MRCTAPWTTRPLSLVEVLRLSTKCCQATGQSARAQKWLDQLCQVESRMLSNWEEFLQHRSEVQLRLQELSEAFRRKQETN